MHAALSVSVVVSCSSHVCLNGGTCTEPVGGKVECRCPPEYSGDRCEQGQLFDYVIPTESVWHMILKFDTHINV